jgi:hypothetical protein
MTAHETICHAVPEMIEAIRRDDPEHYKMMELGWSWVELEGGPNDGKRHYFVGSPVWELFFVDNENDLLNSPGTKGLAIDLHYRYKLERDPADGNAIYRYKGVVKPGKKR